MARFQHYLLLAFILFPGCKHATKNDSAAKSMVKDWLFVSIKANGTEFLVSTYDDTLELVSSSGQMVDSSKYLISKANKDSLFRWTETLIKNELEPIKFCTDYFGKLTLRIDYSDQVSRQIQYRSVCEWQELDSNTLKIKKLIDRIIEQK